MSKAQRTVVLVVTCIVAVLLFWAFYMSPYRAYTQTMDEYRSTPRNSLFWGPPEPPGAGPIALGFGLPVVLAGVGLFVFLSKPKDDPK